MSIYTDLHNKLKETINVDYRTRNTNQEVHLSNERNEYWGRFNGKVNIEDSTISRAQLSDVTLNGDIYVNGRFIGEGLSVDVNKIMDAINGLSSNLYDNDDVQQNYGDIVRHDKKFDEVDENLNRLKNQIEGLIISSDGNLSVVSANIISQISDTSVFILGATEQISSQLSAQISSEVEERKSKDNDITLALGAESNERQTTDKNLSNFTIDVDNKSKQRDFSIIQDLEQHKEDNIKHFSELEEKLISTIAHDKHYAIYDNEEILKTYPYALKDFAVNVLNTSLKDGIVLNDANIPVANIVLGGKTESSEDVFLVTFYDTLDDVKILQAVWPGSQFKLYGGVALPTHKNDYRISLKNNQIYLTSEAKPYLELHYSVNNQSIGKIKNFLSVDDVDNIISGSLFIDAGRSSELSIFNKFKDVEFNNTDLSSRFEDSEEVVFKQDEKKFIFRAGVYDKHYCQIKDETTSKVFGLIYEGDVTSEDKIVDSIKVSIDGQDVVLSAPFFRTDYGKPSSAFMLCCNVNDHVFEKYEKHAHYQYGYYDASDELRGHVVLTAENRELLPLDFNQIKVKIENTALSSLAGREFLLDLDTEALPIYKLWKARVRELSNDLDITLTFSGDALQIKGIIDGGEYDSICKVNYEDVTIENQDSAYDPIVNRSSFVDWEVFPETIPGCKAEYDVNYQVPTRREDFDDVVCGISSDNLSSVDVIVPQKEEGDNISREFIVVANISSILPKIGLNVQGHLPKDPVEITFNGSNTIEISSNVNMILQFNEIADHKFIVTDLENHYQQDQLNFIYEDLSIKAKQISVLSDDVADIYKQIKGGLVYKDILSIDIPFSDKDPEYRQQDFVDLFFNNYWIKDGRYHRAEILNMPLRGGFYYISQAADKSKKYKFEDCEIANGDLIIIKDNTLLSNINRDKINIIDVFDADAVHKDELSAVSSAIELSVFEISNATSLSVESISAFMRDDLSARIYSLSNEVSGVSSLLSSETIRLDKKINDLSDALSIEISAAISSISNTIELSVGKLQSQIIGNDNDIEYLSNEVSTAIRRNLSGLRYFGDVTLSDKYDFERIAELTGNTLFGLLHTNQYTKGPNRELYTGFTYRTKGNDLSIFEVSSDNATKVKTFRNNEILIVNKYVDKLSNISLDDVEIIKDYDLSTYLLQGQIISNDNDIEFLSGQHDWLSSEISNSISSLSTRLSVEIDKLSANLSGDIDSLSNRLSTDISSLSIRISAEIDSLSANLSGDIDSLSNRLSNEISDLNYHYYRTFEKDVHVDIDEKVGPDISVDLLKLTEETGSGTKYTLRLSAGTLVLMPIE